MLSYLAEPRDADAAKVCFEQFLAADCMTDKLAAVACLSGFDDSDGVCPERAEALAKFYKDADGDFLVLNKWFGIQVRCGVCVVLCNCAIEDGADDHEDEDVCVDDDDDDCNDGDHRDGDGDNSHLKNKDASVCLLWAGGDNERSRRYAEQSSN